MHVRFATLAALVALGTATFAQDRAPRETVSATVGGKRVSVEYGRPALKGRAIADLLKQLPADRMWRAGVDQVTTLTAEGDFSLGGKTVPAGKYTLYVNAPETGDWSLAVNRDTGVALKTIFPAAPPELADAPWPHIDDYTKSIADKEVARAPLHTEPVNAPAELFTITLTQAKDGARLTLAWGDQRWSADLKAAAPAKK